MKLYEVRYVAPSREKGCAKGMRAVANCHTLKVLVNGTCEHGALGIARRRYGFTYWRHVVKV